ncbi:MAG: glycosyltransferase [Puniceicoccales bacterium]|jgi:glycosyltransferase involved in cell wall biosynthesis|nr:glycosyltransferase [Puniceicoccales bacterium]
MSIPSDKTNIGDAAPAAVSRIVHFGTGGGSGATRVLLDVAAGQLRSGHDVRVFLRRKRKPLPASFDDVLGALGKRVIWIENLWPKFRLVARIRRELEGFRPDIFFAHGFSDHLWGRLAALSAGVPKIIHVEHNIEKYTPLRRWLAQRLARRTTATVCVSESVARRVKTIGIAAADTRVIPNGTDVERFAAPPVSPPSERPPDIVMAARFCRQKDHATLIRAAGILIAGGWKGKLFLAGGGKKSALAKCRRLVQKLRLASATGNDGASAAPDGADAQILFPGPADMPPLFRRCRFAVLSTHYEGLPLALVEALAAGCACLGSDVPGVRDVLAHDANGLLFPPGDAKKLAAQLQSLLNDPRKCDALAAAGAKSARENFSTERMVADYNTLGGELLQGAEASPLEDVGQDATPPSPGEPIPIFLSFDENYAEHASATILSILKNAGAGARFCFQILHTNLQEATRQSLRDFEKHFPAEFHFTAVDAEKFASLRLTLSHISKETWFRLLIPFHSGAGRRAIYLDCDLIVRGDICELWNTNIGENHIGAVEDLIRPEKSIKNHAELFPKHRYFNAGVLLLNCEKIREHFTLETLLEIAKTHADDFKFQDQDVLNFAFQGRVFYLPFKWNVTEFFFNSPHRLPPTPAAAMKEIVSARENPAIAHFVGKRKPWKNPTGAGASPYASLYFQYAKNASPESYDNLASLRDTFTYFLRRPLFFLKQKHRAMRRVRKLMDCGSRPKIRVALLVDEYFGALGTPFGGYGFLARRYVAKHIPCDDIEIEVLLRRGKGYFLGKSHLVDGVKVSRLPRNSILGRLWLKKRNYDLFLSIELTRQSAKIMRIAGEKTKLMLWIQDPRPKKKWDEEIATMKIINDPCFYDRNAVEMVGRLEAEKRLLWLTQDPSLVPLATELYERPRMIEAALLPNPVEMDFSFDAAGAEKENRVIFLGRLEAQKRCWLFCEVARRMPRLEFFVIGQFFRWIEENKKTLKPYMENPPPNLHFVGHLDAGKKIEMLKTSKILLNTSIWEGIPISWLEALSYGTLLVSNLDNGGLVSRFGIHTGENLGDGFDGIPAYVAAIEKLLSDEPGRRRLAAAAVDYARKTHNVQRFTHDLRAHIRAAVGK